MKSPGEKGFDRFSCYCFEPREYKFQLVRDALDWWREFEYERRQLIMVKERRLIRWHNLKRFAIQPCESELFYQAVQDV